MATKVNPRKKPRTEEDVKKALKDGIELGVHHAIKVCLYILLDKHNAPAEDVQVLSGEIAWLAQHINEHKISWNDVDKVLKENNVEVRVR